MDSLCFTFCLADVIANDFGATWCYWQMFLPCCLFEFATCVLFLAGVIASCLFSLWQIVMLLPSGWCLYWQMLLPFIFVAVGITTLIISCTKRCTTVVVTFFWQMLLPGWLMVLPCIWLADVIAMWLMLLPLLYFLFCWQMLLPGGWCNICQSYTWQYNQPSWQ